MIFEQVRTGGDRNFSYLVADDEMRTGIVVDPSFDCEELAAKLKAYGLTIKYIVNTHSHADHMAGNVSLQKETNAQIVMHVTSKAKHDVSVRDGDVLKFGSLGATVAHTPGHTPDSICILVGGKLITGDTLFVGKVGGTDFGEGARSEYESLKRKLMSLPDETEVWPGHDYGTAASSTIGHERTSNPFLLRSDYRGFLELKKNWPEYKKIHGIK
ncbi:MAG: MBL fold metallo-hydrolase [Candidatus Eisenbacteria bacterium]